MLSFLNHIPQVTKNILILNVLFFLAKFLLANNGIDLDNYLAANYILSPNFKPLQIVTHFFMHGDFFHILMNMWLFVMLGSFLERLWGPKKFFNFYMISAMSAFLLYNIIGVYQMIEIKNIVGQNLNWNEINLIIKNSPTIESLSKSLDRLLMNEHLTDYQIYQLMDYIKLSQVKMLGASGAVFGIMAAFAMLFPNTEFMLYFAIPVKAKYLVGGYFLWELYSSFNTHSGDNVAHLAHVGGAIAGAIMILIWKKRDRQNFW